MKNNQVFIDMVRVLTDVRNNTCCIAKPFTSKEKQNTALEKKKQEIDKQLDSALMKHGYQVNLSNVRNDMWNIAVQVADTQRLIEVPKYLMVTGPAMLPKFNHKTPLDDYCLMQIYYILTAINGVK